MVAYTNYRSDPRCRREAEALARRGDEVYFICLGSGGEPRVERIEGVMVRRLATKRYRGSSSTNYFLSYAAFFFRALWLVSKLSLKYRFDVVHVHSLPDLMVFVALVPRAFGAKVVLDLHELTPELYVEKFRLSPNHPMSALLRLSERLSTLWAHRVVLCTQPQAERLLSRCALQQDPCVVMNVPDPRLFHPCSDGPPSTAGNGVFKIVHHGTLVRRNGVDIVVKALALLDGEVPGAELSIYGGGDFLHGLRSTVSRSGVGELVHLSGRMLPVDALVTAISDAQIGIVPNLDGPVMKVALPTKLMEYFALGVPAIVSRTPAVSRYFDDSMVMFFEPGDPSDLARCIVKLYREPELRRSLARNAKKFLEEHSWEKEKEKLFSVIDSL
jgi:glycosyltransferase involved in cell wall biosynthesis